MSETFSTLHGLVNKGVNVVMDIPYELWNETSAEVADLKKQVLSPEFTGMSENPSSNNFYVEFNYLLRGKGGKTVATVSVRSAQIEIYLSAKEGRDASQKEKSNEGTLTEHLSRLLLGVDFVNMK